MVLSKKGMCLLLIGISFLSCKQNQNSFYLNNQPPLVQNIFIELPLGSIKPKGWLEEMLIRQKKGLTGHLDIYYPLVMDETNGWLGGEGDQWERGPYWIDGLLPLAYILQDSVLQNKVNRWIEWTLNSQREDGYFGPQKSFPNNISGIQRDNADDWWPKMVMLKVLQQYYSATEDQRVISFMTKYFHYQLKKLPTNPLDFRTFWPKYRGGDNLMVVLWLYNITKDKDLLKLAEIIYNQTFDYKTTFSSKNWWATGNMHAVNLAQGIKTLAIYSQYKERSTNLTILKTAFNDIKTFLGYPHGGFSGDEAIHGNNPTQGTELCTIVEYMFSLEKMLQISGDIDYAEQIERMAFNALPAQVDDEYMTRQYFQQTNQISISKHIRNFDTNHDGNDNLLGLLNGYPCCTANMHQGFPKFVQNLWYATPDNGLAAVLFSPSTVTALVGNGIHVNIIENTNYPFSETINLTVNPQEDVSFPLYIRIPTWCKNPQISVNNINLKLSCSNGLYCINRIWSKADDVKIYFPMSIYLTEWYERSKTVERGPLVYALQMKENWEKKKFIGNDAKINGDNYWEVTSNSKWNYALIECSTGDLENQYKVQKENKVPLFPFNTNNAPIKIRTKACILPHWEMYNESAGALPYSITYGMPYNEPDSITLIPYGCTKLRITEFPVVGNYTIK